MNPTPLSKKYRKINEANPLLLPVLRPEFDEAFASNNTEYMREFCSALHPASIADFLAHFQPPEIWTILQACDPPLRAEIFSYFGEGLQLAIVESCPRDQIAKLIEEMPSDDRVDVLDELEPESLAEIIPLLSTEDQEDVALIRGYEDDECGAEMSSDFVRLNEKMTVGEAIAEIGAQTHLMETVYYLYVLDENERLVGIVSAKDLLRRINQQGAPIVDFMKSAGTLVTVGASEKREEAVKLVEKYDFVAIPVVDEEDGRMLGVITHDDILDAAVEELVENAHMSAAVDPLGDESYLDANVFELAGKRFFWLAILLFGAISTALILKVFDDLSSQIVWLVAFLPMIVSTGGNCGGQSATLVVTALATGQISLSDWKKIFRREIAMGAILGVEMSVCGLINALIMYWIYGGSVPLPHLMIVPLAVFFVVFFSNMTGALLPLLFQRMKFDPALMSNPFVAGVSDMLGTFVYMTLALFLIAPLY